MTSLFLASFHGCVEVVRLLLHLGAKPDVLHNDGSTALLVASHHGHVEIVDCLLNAAAAVDMQQKDCLIRAVLTDLDQASLLPKSGG